MKSFEMFDESNALSRKRLPPDDIGNRMADDPSSRMVVSDDIGNSMAGSATHMQSGILKFLQLEWQSSSSSKSSSLRPAKTRSQATSRLHQKSPRRVIRGQAPSTTRSNRLNPTSKKSVPASTHSRVSMQPTKPNSSQGVRHDELEVVQVHQKVAGL